MTNLAVELKRLRLTRGWTQTALANKCGIAATKISLMEDPEYRFDVKFSTLKKLADAFGLALDIRFVNREVE